MIDDDGKLRQRFCNKRVNARKEGIEFDLTFTDFKRLVKQVGLVSSQLGFTGENYVLARYKDRGPYAVGNCRFITQSENMHEQKKRPKTKKQLLVAKRALKAARKALTPEIVRKAGERGAASRAVSLAKEIKERDDDLERRIVFNAWVRYPKWGWKVRLAKELEVSSKRTFLFLKRNPSYINRLVK